MVNRDKDFEKLFPEDEFEILRLVMPIPRSVYDSWTMEQRQTIAEQASKAVADMVTKSARSF